MKTTTTQQRGLQNMQNYRGEQCYSGYLWLLTVGGLEKNAQSKMRASFFFVCSAKQTEVAGEATKRTMIIIALF